MNRLFFLLTAVSVLAGGCVKEKIDEDDTHGSRPLVLYVTMPEYGTRTELDGLNVVWNTGDKISVVDNDNVVHVFENTEASGPAASFATDLTLTDNGIDGPFSGTHTLVYPASQDYGRGDSGTMVQGIVLSDSQPLLANNIGRGCSVSFAGLNTRENYNGDNLTFHNACGLLCLRLRGDVSIKRIMITAPSGSVIAGSGTIDYARGGFINDSAYPFTGTEIVTLKPENGFVSLNDNVTCFYACVVPAQAYTCDVSGITDNVMSTGTGAKAGTYKITFVTDLNEKITTTAILDKDICAGHVSTLGQFNIRYGELDMDPTGRNTMEFSYDPAQGLPVADVKYDGEAADWLTVTVADGAITFKAEVNISGKERFATVGINTGSRSYDVQVCQKPVETIFSYESFGCDMSSCVSGPIVMADYISEFLGYWDFSADADWFTVNRTGDDFTLSIQENTTGVDRSGNIVIRDASGTVISTFAVSQTHFSYDDLSGVHALRFGEDDYWIMDFMKENGGFAVKAVGSRSGFHKTEGHSLRLAYVSCGDGGPKIMLKLPQMLGTVDGEQMMLYATTPDGYYSLTENLGYELLYYGTPDNITFDFVTEDTAYLKGFHSGFNGLFLMKGTKNEDWLVPRTGQDRLRIVKWGAGNHDKFD